ncbi:hypothetical protein ZWY2020_024986 [Hordeum vulgare]|nr:hypothetical protein ZWY2020_024986 [Hordeum vulgare]
MPESHRGRAIDVASPRPGFLLAGSASLLLHHLDAIRLWRWLTGSSTGRLTTPPAPPSPVVAPPHAYCQSPTFDKEHEMHLCMEPLIESNLIVPVKPVMTQAPIETVDQFKEVQVVEVDREVDPKLNCLSDYMVQSPTRECSDEFILTPPLAAKAMLRFNKRVVEGM